MSVGVKGFGCGPLREAAYPIVGAVFGPGSESLQGRNPRGLGAILGAMGFCWVLPGNSVASGSPIRQ